MTEFAEIIEHWCQIYKPMGHIPGVTSKNKRFFFADSYLAMVDVMNNLPLAGSPCVVMESGQEGRVDDKLDHPDYTLYFLVKSSNKMRGEDNNRCKREAKTHMLKFYAYLMQLTDKDDTFDAYEFESLDYQTVGPVFDGWYGVTTTISRTEQYDRCVDPYDYFPEQEENPGTDNPCKTR